VFDVDRKQKKIFIGPRLVFLNPMLLIIRQLITHRVSWPFSLSIPMHLLYLQYYLIISLYQSCFIVCFIHSRTSHLMIRTLHTYDYQWSHGFPLFFFHLQWLSRSPYVSSHFAHPAFGPSPSQSSDVPLPMSWWRKLCRYWEFTVTSGCIGTIRQDVMYLVLRSTLIMILTTVCFLRYFSIG
jgi:hypothetical protein